MKIKVEKKFILSGYDAEINNIYEKVRMKICGSPWWSHGLSNLKAVSTDMAKVIGLIEEKKEFEKNEAEVFLVDLKSKSK